MGQLPPGAVILVETVADALTVMPTSPDKLAWITQTTLSVDDTAAIVKVLIERFPGDRRPAQGRHLLRHDQPAGGGEARLRGEVDAMIVVGAPNSSNSQRLREVAMRAGCPLAVLVQRASDIDWPRFAGIERLGVTAGASAPEALVEEVIDAFAERFDVRVEMVTTTEERSRSTCRASCASRRPSSSVGGLHRLLRRRVRRLHGRLRSRPGCSRSKASPRASRTRTTSSRPDPASSS